MSASPAAPRVALLGVLMVGLALTFRPCAGTLLCSPSPAGELQRLQPAATGTTQAETPRPEASQAPRVGSRRHPHEPPGFTPFAEHDGGWMPPYPRRTGPLLGAWWIHRPGNPRFTIVKDSAAPESPGSVMRTEFPAGLEGGAAPGVWGGWDSTGFEAEGQKREVYFSMWLKIEGRDFENQGAGTKAGFFGVGRRPTAAQNEAFFWLDNGNGVIRPMSRFEVLFKQQGTVQPNGNSARNLRQIPSTRHLMTAGSWHHWEVLMKLNTLGRPNGVFRMWIDGTLTHDYRDVTYIFPGAQNGFNGWK